jgi:DNA-binding transcriptional ArsR family regulator
MGARKSAASESQATTYTLNVTTDSTQVPDWLLLCNALSLPSRVLAGIILLHQKRGEAPTTTTLAGDLAVDERTITRWLGELREAKIINAKREGRNNLYSFLKPRKSRIPDRRIGDPTIGDPTIGDPSIGDPTITDRGIRYSKEASSASGSSKLSTDTRTKARVLHGGGGGHDSFEDLDPPTPPPARRARRIRPEDITEETGKWMVGECFSLEKAYQFQHLPLRPCQLDYQRRRQAGQGRGAIALAWEVEPPAAPPIDQAGESTDGPEAPYVPPPAARTLEEAQRLWEARRARMEERG